MVYIDSDSSWSCQTGQSGFASLDATVSCATPQTAVTFTVNTANITVGENGMYVGGGVLGDAMAYMMTDDDADGTYEVTFNLDQGTTGNYVFLNSPNDGWLFIVKHDRYATISTFSKSLNNGYLSQQ